MERPDVDGQIILHVSDYGWRSPAMTRSQTMFCSHVVSVLRQAGAHTVLDIGCGNGALAHFLANEGFDVTGIDCDERGIAIARRGKGRFVQMSVYDEPTRLGSTFDAAICLEVLEHLFFPAAVPTFAYRVLKSNGILIVSTPYHGWLKNLAISFANRWDRHWNPLRDGGHIKFFSATTLRQLLERHGFRCNHLLGIGRVPLLWKSMLAVAKKTD